MAQKFQMVSDRYADGPHSYESAKQFERDCVEAFGTAPRLTWHTDGRDEWYTDEHGEVVLTTKDTPVAW
jgi:hypothetical protein